jgi:hypothetical protein
MDIGCREGMRYFPFYGTSSTSGIVRRFRRESLRTRSLIITFMATQSLPRGGSVWLGTFLG